jgi:hypothetical protein
MRRRQLPSQLKPALAGLAAVVSFAAAADTVVVAPPEPPPQRIQRTLAAEARAEVAIDVGGDGSGRLVLGTLRTDAALAAIALIDPEGRVVWRRTPAELGAVARAQAPQPELGDAIPLPEVVQPRPGRWQLRLERNGPPRPGARLLLVHRLLPRYALAFWRAGELPAAGQPVLLTLKPTDMGRPVQQPPSLALRVLPQQPDGAALELQARQDLAGPTGARISTEPGAYLAQWRPQLPGSYEIQAAWQPPGSAAPLVAIQRVDVAAAAGQLRFTGLKAEGPPGCVRELVLDFAVQLASPPAAGAVHALAARVLGPRQARQLSTSVKLDSRSGTAELRLSLTALQALGWPLLRIESSQLTRLQPELGVLLTGGPVELAGLLPAAGLCP